MILFILQVPSGGTDDEPKIWVVDKNTINGNIANLRKSIQQYHQVAAYDGYNGIAFG